MSRRCGWPQTSPDAVVAWSERNSLPDARKILCLRECCVTLRLRKSPRHRSWLGPLGASMIMRSHWESLLDCNGEFWQIWKTPLHTVPNRGGWIKVKGPFLFHLRQCHIWTCKGPTGKVRLFRRCTAWEAQRLEGMRLAPVVVFRSAAPCSDLPLSQRDHPPLARHIVTETAVGEMRSVPSLHIEVHVSFSLFIHGTRVERRLDDASQSWMTPWKVLLGGNNNLPQSVVLLCVLTWDGKLLSAYC